MINMRTPSNQLSFLVAAILIASPWCPARAQVAAPPRESSKIPTVRVTPQHPAGWELLDVPEFNVTVSMPATARRLDQEIQGHAMTHFGCNDGQLTYLLTCARISEVASRDLDGLTKGMNDGFAEGLEKKGSKVSIELESRVDVASLHGTQVRIANATEEYRRRTFIKGTIVYSLMVGGPLGQLDQRANNFLNSLRVR